MRSPNILVVVMDTARARDVVRSDRRDAPLPAIDRLAEEGTEYTNAFASAPWTLPSHAGLFTGTHSSKHGAHAGHKYLPDDLPTLAEAFQSSGYETVAVSNNTWISEEFGFARGFETLYKTWQYVQTDTDLGEVARTKRGTEMIRALAARLVEGNPAVNLANAVYGQFFRKRTDDGARRTNEWLRGWLAERPTEKPFFTFVNYLEPHLAYHPPRALAEQHLPNGVTYEEAMAVSQDAWAYITGHESHTEAEFEVLHGLYKAELAYLDRRIGDLRGHLEATGEWEDTIVVVTSDHGENIGDHDLMDHQYSLYDTLLHVPLVVAGGAFDGGDKNDDLVQLTDLAPTLLDAADVDAPAMRESIQGQSFHPDTDADPRTHVIAEYMAPQPSMDALRDQVGPLPDDFPFDRSLRTVRTTEDKLIRGSDGARERYDVRTDPDESTDLAAESPESVAELETHLDDWLESFEHSDASGSVSMTDATKDRLEDLGYL